MRIRFAGTGTGDCKLRKKAGKEYRRRTTVMIDDRLIINPSGDLFDFAAESGLSELFSGLSAAAVTCSEDYCFSPEELGRLAGRREMPLLCGNLAAGRAAGIKNVRAVRYTPMLPMEISGYTVIPVPTGEPGEDIYEIKYNLLIKGERTVYLRLHGGLPAENEWRVISADVPDCVIFAAPLGDAPLSGGGITRGSLEGVLLFERMMSNAGIATERTRFIITSLPTDRVRQIHEETVSLLEGTQNAVAYDGYFVNL